MADRIINENLSVRDLEDIISNGSFEKKVKISKPIVKEARHVEIQNIMREKIGTLVKVNNRNVVIPFDSEKDLERILEILNIDIDLD